MSLVRGVVVSLVLLAGCSRSDAKSTAAVVDEPWSHAYSGDRDGWWMNWIGSLGGKAPFGVGTRFETETVDLNGDYRTDVLEVRSIEPNGAGTFKLMLQSSTGSAYRVEMPPRLSYSPGSVGSIWARNTKLLAITVPAGTFSAGRLWYKDTQGGLVYERDEWVVPDLPIPIQSWSRPVTATELYNPPADGTVPHGTILTRLVRVEKH